MQLRGVVGISIHALREEGDMSGQGSFVPTEDFYPRPPRGGRRANLGARAPWRDFYPRPPRGGRPGPFRRPFSTPGISIHALREEGDPDPSGQQHLKDYFYPRPPRGGRRFNLLVSYTEHLISIHALREEGDPARLRCFPTRCYFYPRPPRGGRPCPEPGVSAG